MEKTKPGGVPPLVLLMGCRFAQPLVAALSMVAGEAGLQGPGHQHQAHGGHNCQQFLAEVSEVLEASEEESSGSDSSDGTWIRPSWSSLSDLVAGACSGSPWAGSRRLVTSGLP